jgi:hypothetical protein
LLQVIVDSLKCGADVAECLLDTAAEELIRVMPYEWQDTKQKELPQVKKYFTKYQNNKTNDQKPNTKRSRI